MKCSICAVPKWQVGQLSSLRIPNARKAEKLRHQIRAIHHFICEIWIALSTYLESLIQRTSKWRAWAVRTTKYWGTWSLLRPMWWSPTNKPVSREYKDIWSYWSWIITHMKQSFMVSSKLNPIGLCNLWRHISTGHHSCQGFPQYCLCAVLALT